MSTPSMPSQRYFTPDSFHEQLPSLLIGLADRTSELRLCALTTADLLCPPGTTAPSQQRDSHKGTLQISAEFIGLFHEERVIAPNPPPAPHATIKKDEKEKNTNASYHGSPPPFSTAWVEGVDGAAPRTRESCHRDVLTVLYIRGDTHTITSRWCSAIQRTFSVASLLLRTDANEDKEAEAEEAEEAAEEETEEEDARQHRQEDAQTWLAGCRARSDAAARCAPCDVSTQSGGSCHDHDAATQALRMMPVTHARHGCVRVALRWFRVDLIPLLPVMVWDRDVDGVFGSVHSLVRCGTLQLADDVADDAHRRAVQEPFSARHGAERRFGIRVAAVLNAAVPAPAQHVIEAVCRGTSKTNSKSNVEAARSLPCPTSHIATACVVVLHAPGTALLTASSPSTASSPFEAMCQFTSNVLLPRVDLECILGASLQFGPAQTQRMNSSLQTTQTRKSARGEDNKDVLFGRGSSAVQADDVCHLATLGTSHVLAWRMQAKHSQHDDAARDEAKVAVRHRSSSPHYAEDMQLARAPAARPGCRRFRADASAHPPVPAADVLHVVAPHPSIQNIVLILDIPQDAWRCLLRMEAAAAAAASTSPNASTLKDTSRASLKSALDQLARLVEDAIAALVHENTDVCFFNVETDAGRTTTRTTAGSQPPSTEASLSGQGASASSCFSSSAAPQYTRRVLAKSIAESITSILFSSPSQNFIAEAERLLFSPSSQTSAPRHECASRDQSCPHGAAEAQHGQDEEVNGPAAAAGATSSGHNLSSPDADCARHGLRNSSNSNNSTHRYTANEVQHAIEALLR